MKRAWFLVEVLISAACLFIAVRMIDPVAAFEAVRQARPLAVIIALLLMPLAVLCRAWRWWYILRRKHVLVPFRTILRVTYIGMALCLMLPGGAGDVVRSYYAWRSAGDKEAMLASAIVDKVVALFALCVLGSVCALAMGLTGLFLATLAFTTPLAGLLLFPRLVPWGWAAFVFRRVFRRKMDTARLASVFRMNLRTLLNCVLISLLAWAATNMIHYAACMAFRAGAPL